MVTIDGSTKAVKGRGIESGADETKQLQQLTDQAMSKSATTLDTILR